MGSFKNDSLGSQK